MKDERLLALQVGSINSTQTATHIQWSVDRTDALSAGHPHFTLFRAQF